MQFCGSFVITEVRVSCEKHVPISSSYFSDECHYCGCKLARTRAKARAFDWHVMIELSDLSILHFQ
jgi:hypothetical protein